MLHRRGYPVQDLPAGPHRRDVDTRRVVSGLLVRPVLHGELFALLDLYLHLHEDGDAPLPPRGHVEALWAAILDDPRLHYLVGEVDGALVSSCTLAIVPNLTRGARPYGLVENVVTHRDHRKKGYGTQVLERALEIAWSAGCYKVMLLTGSGREATLRFYENAGFKRDVKTGLIAYPRGSDV
jgi:GNAT superfamily N-acetyltransferase